MSDSTNPFAVNPAMASKVALASEGLLLPEVVAFHQDPMGWCNEWLHKNGAISMNLEDLNGKPTHVVRLFVKGRIAPLATGCHDDLPRAFENAIRAMTGLAATL